MFFRPIIDLWGVERLAEALTLPRKNVRRWIDHDSIPAEWFAAVARAAALENDPSIRQISVEFLASRAEERRLTLKSATPVRQNAVRNAPHG